MKNLPYEKTIVAELKVQLADLFTRTVVLKSSVANAIPTTDVFNSGDATITRDTPLQINTVKNCVILSSFEDFEIVIRTDGGDLQLMCRGLFLHNGRIENILVRPVAGRQQVRLQYIWS